MVREPVASPNCKFSRRCWMKSMYSALLNLFGFSRRKQPITSFSPTVTINSAVGPLSSCSTMSLILRGNIVEQFEARLASKFGNTMLRHLVFTFGFNDEKRNAQAFSFIFRPQPVSSRSHLLSGQVSFPWRLPWPFPFRRPVRSKVASKRRLVGRDEFLHLRQLRFSTLRT